MWTEFDYKDEKFQYSLLSFIFSMVSKSFEYSRDNERKYTNAIIMSIYILGLIYNKETSYHCRSGAGSWKRSRLSLGRIKELRQKMLDEGYILNHQEFYLRIPPFDDWSFVLDSWAKNLWIEKLDKIIVKQSFGTHGEKNIEFIEWDKSKLIDYNFNIKNPRNSISDTGFSLTDLYNRGKIKRESQSLSIEWKKKGWENLVFELFEWFDQKWSLGKFEFKSWCFKKDNEILNEFERNILPKHLLSSFLFPRDYEQKKEISIKNKSKFILQYTKDWNLIEEDCLENGSFTRTYYDVLPIHWPIGFDFKNRMTIALPKDEKNINKLFKEVWKTFWSQFSIFVKDCFSSQGISIFWKRNSLYSEYNIPLIKDIVFDTLSHVLKKTESYNWK